MKLLVLVCTVLWLAFAPIASAAEKAWSDQFSKRATHLAIVCIEYRTDTKGWPIQFSDLHTWAKQRKKKRIDWKKAEALEFTICADGRLVIFSRSAEGTPELGLLVTYRNSADVDVTLTKDPAKYFAKAAEPVARANELHCQ